MHNPFTEAEEYEYRQVMHERAREREQQRREDAMDSLDDSEASDD